MAVKKGRKVEFWSLALFSLSALLPKIFAVAAVPIQLYGLNYNTRQGPDWDPYKCKSREQIVTDLRMLRRMTNRIRLLSIADCNAAEVVLDVIKKELGADGMQIWLGLWVAEDVNVFLGEKAALANLLNRGLIDSNTVLGITVGSEAIFRQDVTIAENIDYMTQVKDMLENANLNTLPVSIVDIAETYMNNPLLTAAVDVIYANIFPFWENLSLDRAIPSMLEDLGMVQDQPEAAGKRLVIGETGWPASGVHQVIQPGSIEGQVTFFEKFYCRMDRELNFEYFYFTGINNDWRQVQDPTNTIEGTWGVLYSNLTIKPHFANLVFTCADGTEYSFAETDWSIPSLLTIAPATTTPSNTPTISPVTSLPTTTPPSHQATLEPTTLPPNTFTPTSTTTPLPSPIPSPVPSRVPTVLPTNDDGVTMSPSSEEGKSQYPTTIVEDTTTPIPSPATQPSLTPSFILAGTEAYTTAPPSNLPEASPSFAPEDSTDDGFRATTTRTILLSHAAGVAYLITVFVQ